MDGTVKAAARRYHAPRRAAAAAQTREAILHAAKDQFEAHGWAATTIAAIATEAAVSPKTIQALFGTKAALLAAAVDYAIAGDVAEVPVIARQSARSVESAPDAATMLDRHAGHVVAINTRSAGLAQVVESAAGSSQLVASLWEQMTANRRLGGRAGLRDRHGLGHPPDPDRRTGPDPRPGARLDPQLLPAHVRAARCGRRAASVSRPPSPSSVPHRRPVKHYGIPVGSYKLWC